MKRCYSCFSTEEKVLLYEGIHKADGRVFVCRKCYFKDKIPLINTKNVDWNEVEKPVSVRERLRKVAGIKDIPQEYKKLQPHIEDVKLKDIIERNFKKETVPKNQATDLIDNFNWVVMMKRRSMKISQKKFAEEIFEELLVIESLEKGILPKNYIPLIKKVESYLEVKLLKEKSIGSEDIVNETRVPSGLRVRDLKVKNEILPEELDIKKVEEVSGRPIFKNPSKKPNDELSDEDISDLIWGRKG